MQRATKEQAGRARIAFAAVAVAAALGAPTAWAAPPTDPTFVTANISIAAGSGGGETATAAGGLTCSWRQTGLQPFQLITYACDAAVVGAIEACVDKNKVVAGSATQFTYFRNPLASLEGGAVGFVSNNSGRINGATTTPVPVSEGHGGHLCAEPAVATVVAVRWCSASLTDTVNNIVGATVSELFQQFYSGVPSTPSCAELLAMP